MAAPVLAARRTRVDVTFFSGPMQINRVPRTPAKLTVNEQWPLRKLRDRIHACIVVAILGAILAGCASSPNEFKRAINRRQQSSQTAKFRVLVTNLDGDQDGSVKRVLLRRLYELDSVEVEGTNVSIPFDWNHPERSESTGRAQALQLLRAEGSDIAIWGQVLQLSGAPEVVLFWTSNDAPDKPVSAAYDLHSLSRPKQFLEDLGSILQLSILTQALPFLSQSGQYVGPKLSDLIARLETLVSSPSLSTWRTRDQSSAYTILALAMGERGEHLADPTLLANAIEYSRKAAKLVEHDASPFYRAQSQGNLATTLVRLGKLQSESDLLHDAATACIAAIEGFTEAGEKLSRAMAQSNLGTVHLLLAQRESRVENLESAAIAMSDSIKVLTRAETPLLWANVQTGLGIAHLGLGEGEASTDRIEKSIGLLQAALEERRRESVPLDWAQTQSALGTAYRQLGERTTKAQYLQQAVSTYKLALGEYTRTRAPLMWAHLQHCIGHSLVLLWQRGAEPKGLSQAAAAFKLALEEVTYERSPREWATLQASVANTLFILGRHEESADFLERAVTAFHAAIEVLAKEAPSVHWADCHIGLGLTYLALAEHAREQNGKRTHLDTALKAFEVVMEKAGGLTSPVWAARAQRGRGLVMLQQEDLKVEGPNLLGLSVQQAIDALKFALEGLRDRSPIEWAETQSLVGHALFVRWERHRDNVVDLTGAVDALEAAVQVLSVNAHPWLWGQTRRELAFARILLGKENRDTGSLLRAIELYQDLMGATSRDHSPVDWATIQWNLGRAHYQLGELGDPGDPAPMLLAIAKFQAAHEGITQDKAPLDWAKVHCELGTAYMALAPRTRDVANYKRALTSFYLAQSEPQFESEIASWVDTHANIGFLEMEMSRIEQASEHEEKAVAAYQGALKRVSEKADPVLWAKLQESLGATQWALARSTEDKNLLRAAAEAYRAALRMRPFIADPAYWEPPIRNLAEIERQLRGSSKP